MIFGVRKSWLRGGWMRFIAIVRIKYIASEGGHAALCPPSLDTNLYDIINQFYSLGDRDFMSNLNWVDIVILVIFFASVLAGLIRGFVKEIISLVTWIAAFFIATMFASKLAAWFTSFPSVQSMISSA